MKWMKWLISLLALAPVAFVTWFYFTLRANRDSGYGSAWVPVYGAPEWAIALALAAFAVALLYLIHGPRRLRSARIAVFAVTCCLLTLAYRDLHHQRIPGEYREASLLFIASPVVDLGYSELMCRETSAFGITIVNPENGKRASFFRGVWPWSFSDEELGSLGDPC